MRIHELLESIDTKIEDYYKLLDRGFAAVESYCERYNIPENEYSYEQFEVEFEQLYNKVKKTYTEEYKRQLTDDELGKIFKSTLRDFSQEDFAEMAFV